MPVGRGVGLRAAYLAGVGGNILAVWVHEATACGLGGSGVVMGALGLLTFPSFPFLKQRVSNALRLIAGGMSERITEAGRFVRQEDSKLTNFGQDDATKLCWPVLHLDRIPKKGDNALTVSIEQNHTAASEEVKGEPFYFWTEPAVTRITQVINCV